MNLGSTVGVVGFSSGNISVDTAILSYLRGKRPDGDRRVFPATVLEEASMLARMIASARRSIVVADASKFGCNAFAQIARSVRSTF